MPICIKTRFYLTANRATGLLAKGKITQDMIKLLDKWRHTGFNVYCGPRILPWQRKSMENLACYTIRASFSQERMTYHRETGQVEYRSKDRKETKVLHALEWLAAMCYHVPNKGEQMVRYYGYYSNVVRGKRKKADADDKIPCILEPELTDMAFRKNWARLIQKIYEFDPPKCPKCQGCIRVIAFIEDEDVIKKILQRRASPQAFGLVGGESEAVTAIQRAALYFGFISNSFCG